MHVHGAHAINKNGMPKYSSSLVLRMQADLNLGKLTASHFGYYAKVLPVMGRVCLSHTMTAIVIHTCHNDITIQT